MTGLHHNDNNGARYGLFENLGVLMWRLGGKRGQIFFLLPCFPPETKCLGDKNRKRVFRFICLFILFSDDVCTARANRDPGYIGGT